MTNEAADVCGAVCGVYRSLPPGSPEAEVAQRCWFAALDAAGLGQRDVESPVWSLAWHLFTENYDMTIRSTAHMAAAIWADSVNGAIRKDYLVRARRYLDAAYGVKLTQEL